MNKKISPTSMAAGIGWLRYWPVLLALLLWGDAWGANDCNDHKDPTIYFNPCLDNCPGPRVVTYAARANTTPNPPINEEFRVDPASGPALVFWDVSVGTNCSGSAPAFTCHSDTFKVTLPDTSGGVPLPKTDPARLIIDTPIPGISPDGDLTVLVTDAANTSNTCTQIYRFHITSDGGGWGDPHITTVDGVHYDFQSAGEFVALRGNGLEIQTRQTPVSTAGVPGANPYTGLASCVSIYSAVATRVGKHRVTYQPNLSGEPDPSGMQLRVDGELVRLGPEGIDLGSEGPVIESSTDGTPSPGGRIVNSPAGSGIEIHYADGTQLVVTPAFWDSQQKWYLNVNVYGTTATEGIFGKLARDSWLPAIPDGEGGLESLGSKPEDMHERYEVLYEKFADAWRVTDKTSLFDYAPGTSTATFTKPDGWPRENPRSCAIEGEPLAQPLDRETAEKHCAAIADRNMKADCIFDVSVTGHPGFAETYQLTEQLQPGLTVTVVKDDEDPTKSGEKVTFTATVAQKLSRGGSAPAGTVQFILDGAAAGDPVALDENGRASWTTSNLKVGQHQVAAKFAPSGWGGGLFMASSSPEESHTVVEATDQFFWLILLLIIVVLILLIIWRYRKQ